MGLVTLPSFGSDPATVTAALLDGKVDPLATEFNGNIENVNIKAGAAIAYSKLNLATSIVNADISASAAIVDTKLAQITTAGKVHFSSLVVGSQATGDIAYASSATVWTRLAAGTTSQVLRGAAGAPTWGALPQGALPAGSVVQNVNSTVVTSTTGTDVIPDDDSIPQNDEGDEFMTLAITPTSATNKLKIDVLCFLAVSSGNRVVAALFQDSTAAALACGQETSDTNGVSGVRISWYMDAGTTSATTFKVRGGSAAGTTTFNGSAGARKYGGALASSINITEIKV